LHDPKETIELLKQIFKALFKKNNVRKIYEKVTFCKEEQTLFIMYVCVGVIWSMWGGDRKGESRGLFCS